MQMLTRNANALSVFCESVYDAMSSTDEVIKPHTAVAIWVWVVPGFYRGLFGTWNMRNFVAIARPFALMNGGLVSRVFVRLLGYATTNHASFVRTPVTIATPFLRRTSLSRRQGNRVVSVAQRARHRACLRAFYSYV